MILVKISCITLFKPLYVYVPLKIKVYLREFKRKKKKKEENRFNTGWKDISFRYRKILPDIK